jgi:hypothetical protein
MITIEDCKAFCDADPASVDALACREHLPMVGAYALAHQATVCANDGRMAAPTESGPYRLAA